MKWTIAVTGLTLMCAASAQAQKLKVKIIDRQDKRRWIRLRCRALPQRRCRKIVQRYAVPHSPYCFPMAG